MPTTLEKPLKRVIRVFGVEAPVIATFTKDGIEMQVKGSRMKLSAPWVRIASSLFTAMNVKSYHNGQPLEVLKYEASKVLKKGE